MYSEKTGVTFAFAIALVAILAIGTGSFTGGISGGVSGDAGGLISMTFILAVIAIFALATIAVLKLFFPEGGFHQ